MSDLKRQSQRLPCSPPDIAFLPQAQVSNTPGWPWWTGEVSFASTQRRRRKKPQRGQLIRCCSTALIGIFFFDCIFICLLLWRQVNYFCCFQMILSLSLIPVLGLFWIILMYEVGVWLLCLNLLCLPASLSSPPWLISFPPAQISACIFDVEGIWGKAECLVEWEMRKARKLHRACALVD